MVAHFSFAKGFLQRIAICNYQADRYGTCLPHCIPIPDKPRTQESTNIHQQSIIFLKLVTTSSPYFSFTNNFEQLDLALDHALGMKILCQRDHWVLATHVIIGMVSTHKERPLISSNRCHGMVNEYRIRQQVVFFKRERKPKHHECKKPLVQSPVFSTTSSINVIYRPNRCHPSACHLADCIITGRPCTSPSS